MEDQKPEEQEDQKNDNQETLVAEVKQDEVVDTVKPAQNDEIENPEDPLGSGDEVHVVEEEEDDGEQADPSRPKKRRRRLVKRVKRKAEFD